jgi:hypothetical protein
MNEVAPVTGKPLLTARALQKDLLLLSVCSFQSGWLKGSASYLEVEAELKESHLRLNPAGPGFPQSSWRELRHRNKPSTAS